MSYFLLQVLRHHPGRTGKLRNLASIGHNEICIELWEYPGISNFCYCDNVAFSEMYVLVLLILLSKGPMIKSIIYKFIIAALMK